MKRLEVAKNSETVERRSRRREHTFEMVCCVFVFACATFGAAACANTADMSEHSAADAADTMSGGAQEPDPSDAKTEEASKAAGSPTTDARATAANGSSESSKPDASGASPAGAAAEAPKSQAPTPPSGSAPQAAPPASASASNAPAAAAASSPTAVGAADSDWPADCEEHYVLRAHGTETAGDETPYRVAGGGDEIIQFYYDVPWRSDQQVLMVRSHIDNRAIVHHWDLYTIPNYQGPEGGIFTARSFLDQLSLTGAALLFGGGNSPEDIRLPSDIGFRLPDEPNLGLLLEYHYFAADGDAQDASSLEVCVSSKPRDRVAGSHVLGADHFALPPHQPTDILGTCVPKPLPEPVHIIGLAPHMHETGKRAKLVLNRASGEQIVLHDQPYDWTEQRVYWIKGPDGQSDVVLNPGDTLTTTCTYDNPRDTTVLSGPEKENEMCAMFTWAWPAGILNNGQAADPTSGVSPDYACVQQ